MRPLLFGAPTAILTNIGGVLIDAVLTERSSEKSSISENPIEDGRYFTDNIVNLPAVLDLEGRLSDTPFLFTRLFTIPMRVSLPAGLSGQADMIPRNPVNGLAKTAAGLGRPGMAKIALEALRDMRRKKQRFDVMTTMDFYQNMVFEEITPNYSSEDGHSIRFTATLRQLIIGDDLGTAGPSAIDATAKHYAASAVSLGMQSALKVSALVLSKLQQ